MTIFNTIFVKKKQGKERIKIDELVMTNRLLLRNARFK